MKLAKALNQVLLDRIGQVFFQQQLVVCPGLLLVRE